MNFKSMSIDKLTKLKGELDAILASKVVEARRLLEAQLAKLDGFGARAKRSLRSGLRGKVAPRYRNPADPSETWAGRGLRPRWLTAALKAGKKLESFAISSDGKKATGKSAKKKSKAVRKTRTKKRNAKTIRKPRVASRPHAVSAPGLAPAAQP
jgi:DNA-binding protein H-NS